jgi:uncharacterized Zn finger protein (UPF0148 family)
MLPTPNTTTMAPPGKHCSRCPCHTAVIIFDGEALCAACDDGTHPAIAEQPTTEPQRAPEAPEPESQLRKVSMRRLTPDQIAAIQAAPLSETTTALAKRLGLNGNTVSYQRLVFQRKQGKAKYKAAPSIGVHFDLNSVSTAEQEEFVRTHAESIRSAVNNAFSPTPIAASKMPESEEIDWEPQPEPNLPRSCKVALDVDEKTLDAWWAAQSCEIKGKLFAGNYVIRVEGIVR